MLQIIGYIILIGIAFLVIKFGIMLVVRCCVFGIIAFFSAGFISLILVVFGAISTDTAWTLSKWAFYIGTAFNVIEVICHPFRAISDAWEVTTDESTGSIGSSSSFSDYNGNSEDEYPGVHCCGNCRWNVSTYSSSVMCNHNPAGEYNGVMDRCSDYCQK